MNKNNKLVLIIVAVLVLVVAAVILLKPTKSNAPSTSSSNNSKTSDTNKPVASTISYDGQAFSVTNDTVNSGDTIRVVNNSKEDLDFDSDPHPVHTDDPDLNAGAIAPGQSKSFTVTKKGTWGFHNHLNANQRGSITIK